MASPPSGRRASATTEGRFPAVAAADEPPTTAVSDISGQSCRSCTAVIIADCVALCCCPCAVVNLLTFAFLRVPWILSRRCLSIIRKKRSLTFKTKKKKKVQEEVHIRKSKDNSSSLEVRENGGILGMMEQGHFGNVVISSFEAEKLWLEWYQVGQWGFGRVSFSGVSCRET